jgi:hypothetical protein
MLATEISLRPGMSPKRKFRTWKSDEEEENHPRHALDGVEPVARVRVGEVVRPRLPRDEEAVDGVVDERDEDARVSMKMM